LAVFSLALNGNFPLSAQNTGPVLNQDSDNFANFQNQRVDDILNTYERLSGKLLIRDVQLANVPPMSINAEGLSKAEALKMIEATLLLNGVAFVAVDDHTEKVIMVAAQAKTPRSEGVKIYANATDLPQTDTVVSYYMPLSYITPTEALQIFSGQAPIHGSYGAYTPAPSAQAIIITESTSVIRELIALKELIDVPPASVVSVFIQLNRADAEKVADLITKMLTPSPNAAAAAQGVPIGGVPAGVGNTAPLSNEHNLISGTAQVIPDTRSNRLLIITRPVNIPFFKQVASELDQPDIYMVPQRRPLKYVLAQDILPALEASLAQGKEEEKQIEKGQGNTNGTNTNTQGSGAASSGGASSSGAGTVSAITPQLQAPAENYVPTVVTIGKTRLLADNRSNSIIVFGSPDVTSRVFGMIDELDRKPLQVYLATVIGELTVTEGEEFGIDWLQKYAGSPTNGIASSNLTTGKGTSSSASLPEPGNLLASTIFPLASGLTLYGQIGGTINAYVRALETTDRFKVISRPSVYTTNNKLAVIASGSQVPVPSNITSGFNGTSGTDVNNGLTTTANIAYQNVLLQLDIIPLINANREVTLKIRQTDNTLGANNVISGNNVPTINTQEINTEITVHDKSTVVIGGLITDTNKHDTTGVPLLSDIPVLGYLFKDTTKSKERDELIIMIQPSVVETDIDQNNVDAAEKHRTLLGQEAERAANGFSEDVPKAFLPPKTTTTTTTSTTYSSKGSAPVKSPSIEATSSKNP